MAVPWEIDVYLFLDTEFARDTDGNDRLLSIGICGSGTEEFYAEVDAPFAPAADDKFLVEYVLPQMGRWPAVRRGMQDIATALVGWLNSLGHERLEVCYDYHADFNFVEELMAKSSKPLSVALEPCHVAYLLGDAYGEAAAARCWREVAGTRGLSKHHALADALALRERFRAVHG